MRLTRFVLAHRVVGLSLIISQSNARGLQFRSFSSRPLTIGSRTADFVCCEFISCIFLEMIHTINTQLLGKSNGVVSSLTVSEQFANSQSGDDARLAEFLNQLI